MKQFFKVFILCIFITMSMCSYVFAADLNSLTGGSGTNSNSGSNQNSGVSSGGSTTTNGSAVTDYFKTYTPVTEENMKVAQTYGGPVVFLLGNATGIIIMITGGLLFLMTAIDLLYIVFPPVRNYLYRGQQSMQGAVQNQGGAMNAGFGGGRMGYGGMQGSMQGGGMGQQPPTPTRSKAQWVSYQAIFAVLDGEAMAQQQQPQQQQGGMMGMGMGMQQQQPQQQQQGGGIYKDALFVYFKRRTIFTIMFFICSAVLTSSVLSQSGINVGILFLKALEKLNGIVNGISF